MVVVASGINKRTSVALPLIRGLADNRVEIKQQLGNICWQKRVDKVIANKQLILFFFFLFGDVTSSFSFACNNARAP